MAAKGSSARGKRPAVVSAARQVWILGDNGARAEIPMDTRLQSDAMAWSYRVQRRYRWLDSEESRAAQARQARETLVGLGLDEEALTALSQATVLEVRVPYLQEDVGWEGRVFPWEYVLSAALREPGSAGHSVVVIRHLDCLQNPGFFGPTGPPSSAVFVESSPGQVAPYYSFDAERVLVREALQISNWIEWPVLHLASLEEFRGTTHPGVIHVAGVDVHQAAQLGLVKEGRCSEDGIVIPRLDGQLDWVKGPDLARMLVGGGPPPLLVAFNLFHSGARLASLAVAEGAGAAIGFQDEIDDTAAEHFFESFYRQWRSEGWTPDLIGPFLAAAKAVRETGKAAIGTGMVLWSRTSLLRFRLPSVAARPEAPPEPVLPPPPVEVQPAAQPSVLVLPDDPQELDKLISVLATPVESLNYALLQNRRSLFQTFRIGVAGTGLVSEIGVLVELQVGDGSTARFHQRMHLRGPGTADLKDSVRLPLTFGLRAAFRESVTTTMKVLVEWCDVTRGITRTLYDQTEHVSLIPLNEWQDTDPHTQLLPAFVLPRDPAVEEILRDAQRNLIALTDSVERGFDGYQQARSSPERVDRQVQAIWAALSFDRNIAYVNPPPSYTRGSQRLRSPSDVLCGHRGTCIDLALLVCACLELIDLYPVIFLLKGHAFPGSWRTLEAHQDFKTSRELAQQSRSQKDPGTPGMGRVLEPWYFAEELDYEQVVKAVATGGLVPMETIWLTRRRGFGEAIDQGRRNLAMKTPFEALVDVRLARTAKNAVTPLPLMRGDNS